MKVVISLQAMLEAELDEMFMRSILRWNDGLTHFSRES
jgi:hypothetical protein